MTKPKKRVYELARELNLTNKALLEKIDGLDLGLSSHMSTLDDDMENHVRQLLSGINKSELEEKRIKPTVIRRRRKVAKPSAKTTAEKAAQKSEMLSEEPVEQPAETVVEVSAEALEAAVPEMQEAEPADQIPEKITAPDKAPGKDTSKIEEQPAKITKKADILEATAAKSAKSKALTDEPAEEPATKPLKAKTIDTAKKGKKAKKADKGKPEPEKQKKKTVAKTKSVKTKKSKKDTPAKIIKLPQRQPEPEPEVVVPKPAQALKVVPQAVSQPERPKKKGKKKGVKEEETQRDKRFLKKKITFRKKAVVEGADLYTGRKRSRKGRKAGKTKDVASAQKTQITTAKAIKRRIKIDETIILADLAKRMGIKASEMIAKLMGMGVMATVNQTIDYETAALVAAEFNYEIEKAVFEEEDILKLAQNKDDDPGMLKQRPPVVTIMGHVDHGKTSLLDVIRKSRVTAGEAGGITQHIGAYLVSTKKGNIAFLDTPGHEAFSAMRSRGANITDLVVLVVAADDGVMPQTVEAINHSKASKVPIIVAVNKIDKPDADPERVQRQLSEIGIVSEEWGGENIFVPVSAKAETGIDDLLEMILLQAEMLELKANPDKLAVGHVVEAKLDSGRGPVATVLVKEGTLKSGDAVVCGVHYGKVRALIDDHGLKAENAGPSMPVEIIGLNGVPMAGDEMVAVADEKDAKQVSEHRTQKHRAKELAKTSRLSLDKLYERMQKGEVKDLNVIVRADVDGSLEAIRDSLTKLSNEEVAINIVHSATGTITESDISLAAVSDAIIVGFNVRPNAKVQEMAQEENVDIRYHNIIYNVIKEIKGAIVGMMKSTFEERILGRAEVRQTFHVPKIGTIAGCYITDGYIERGQQTRLLRDGIVTYDGKNNSLRRFKDDVKEVQNGYECGIGLEKFNDIKVGDIIECYYLEEVRPEVD